MLGYALHANGKLDEALVAHQKAVQKGCDDVGQLDGDDDPKSLRSDTRYAELEDAMAKGAVQVQVYEQVVARKNARAAWFTRKDSLAQKDADHFVLTLHDPAVVRKHKLDAYQAEGLRDGVDLALTHGIADDGADELAFTVTMQKGSTTEGEITIRFGSHVLTTPFVAKLD